MARQHRHTGCLLLVGSLWLVAASASMDVIINRFGRSLLQQESEAPNYLVPNMIPALCTGPNCCQEDDHTSAYQVMMLNQSQAQIAGRTYTTFFMKLVRSSMCQANIDTFGCCNANITTVWIDIDPNLNVVASTLNGASMNSIQDDYGFRFSLSPSEYQLISSAESLLTVTVSGAVDQLCPIPDLAPVMGLCDVILQGDNATHAGSCCPRGLSIDSTYSNWEPPVDFFHCNADLGASPFSMSQAYVSPIYIAADGSMYVDYVLNLTRNDGCSQGPNSCCGMQLTDLELRVLASAPVTGLTIDAAATKYTQSPFNEEGLAAPMQVLSVNGLSWRANDVPKFGKEVVITVSVPAGASEVPHLCGPPTGDSGSVYGECSYYFYQADNSFCCPSGQTQPVIGPVIPTTCNPTTPVPIAESSMLFTYYEFFNGPKHADFVFQVATQRPCTRANCVEMCGWSLAVNDAVLDDASFQVQDVSNVVNAALTSRTMVQRGSNAAVLFSYAPASDQSFYRVRTPVGTKLEQLCRGNAHPDQGSWPCVATLKSGNVYAVMFFDQNSLAIKEYPNYCPAAYDLAESCVRPSQVRYNSPDGNSATSMQFVLTRYDPSTTGCKDVAGLPFSIMLQRQPVEELQDSNALAPSGGITFVSTSGITWPGSDAPTSIGGSTNYNLQLDGTADLTRVCIQGLPDQPPNSCMVQLFDGSTCFNGFVTPTHDPSFTWSGSGGGSTNKAAKIVPAVVVPIVVVAVAVLAGVFFVRKRRRNFNAAYSPTGEPDLRSPLNDGGSETRDTSDVHIRLQGSGRRR